MLVSLSQAIDHSFLIMPQLARIVNDFKAEFPKCSDSTRDKYYQLNGDVAIRCAKNSHDIKTKIVIYCKGNPYDTVSPLKSMASSLVIHTHIREDILIRDDKGSKAFEAFVKDCLLPQTTKSVWDPMKKIKLKTFATWMKKSVLKVGEKVIKL